MPEIIVSVSKDGETKILVYGVAGPGCRDLSKAIEDKLGSIASIEPTSEYYEEAEEQQEEIRG